MSRTPSAKACQECGVIKPRSDFTMRYHPVAGQWRISNKCNVCNGSLGHKVCKACGVDKPIDLFVLRCEDTPEKRTIRSECKPCLNNKSPRNLTTRAARAARSSQVQARRATRVRKESAKPPGWTPPPTQEQMAKWYSDMVANAKPLEGFAS